MTDIANIAAGLRKTIASWLRSDGAYESYNEAAARIEALKAERKVAREGFQNRVAEWMLQCFTPEVADDKLERTDRFIEEALELAQTNPGFTADRAHALVDYVFGRAVGEPAQGVGGVMVTLAALCAPNGLDMMACGEAEYQRISQPEVIKKIRTKQAAKPVGSALPIANMESDDAS